MPGICGSRKRKVSGCRSPYCEFSVPDEFISFPGIVDLKWGGARSFSEKAENPASFGPKASFQGGLRKPNCR